MTKDVPAVALECGTSPAKIFSNYRAVATDTEANAWFSIHPAAQQPRASDPVQTSAKCNGNTHD
jgi:hypothetical protein